MPLICDAPVDTTPVPTKALKTTAAPQEAVQTTSATETYTTIKTAAGVEYTPMQPSGLLDQYDSYRITPKLGTEFRNVSLKDWITGPNSDAHIRELGILISRRGVVSFRDQTDMTDDLQREFCIRLGQLTGQPKENGMYEHPMNMVRGDERDMQTLDVAVQKKTHFAELTNVKQTSHDEWHSDVPGEVCPASYTMLRMTDVPECGADTMFLDGYELYERLSMPYRKFAESLTGYSYIAGLNKAMKANIDNPLLNLGPRGAPQNVGVMTRQEHPLVRTNPVTGWKSLYHTGLFYDGIKGFTDQENYDWKEKITNLVCRNHDMQLRYRWNKAGDMAIWDNRSTLHAATQDYSFDPSIFGARLGRRCLSTGEEPFYDPNSTSRYEAMGENYC